MHGGKERCHLGDKQLYPLEGLSLLLLLTLGFCCCCFLGPFYAFMSQLAVYGLSSMSC